MYTVHASIVLPGSRFTSFESMGDGRSEMEDTRILYTGIPIHYEGIDDVGGEIATFFILSLT